MAELLTRGTRRRSARDIAAKVESRGGSFSAFAGQNSFGLQARCLKEDAGVFMDLLADCLLHPLLRQMKWRTEDDPTGHDQATARITHVPSPGSFAPGPVPGASLSLQS